MHQINVPSSAIFFSKISEELKSSLILADSSFVIGGDFSVIFDYDLDGSRGIKKTKESVKILEDICLEQDLIDIWRVRNPTDKHFKDKNKLLFNFQKWEKLTHALCSSWYTLVC